MPEKTEYQHGQFCWVDLIAHDMGPAQKFYGDLFGWSAVSQDTKGGPPYEIFEMDGKSVAGMGPMSDEMKAHNVPATWNSYINVDNVEEIAQKAEALGGEVTMPTMKVLEAGWMAFIQDPTGGNVALWQKNQHIGAGRTTDPGCFCWNELATRDVETARDFYGSLLGWEFSENPHAPTTYYIIKNNGQDSGGLIQMTDEWADMPPHWAVYFTVDNADAATEKHRQLGGIVLMEPFDIPVGRISVVGDPQGAFFSLFEFGEQVPQL